MENLNKVLKKTLLIKSLDQNALKTEKSLVKSVMLLFLYF